MKTEFKPIAMRCTEQQFNELKPRLEEYGLEYDDVDDFEMMPYLVNFRWKQKNNITNYLFKDCRDFEIIETFNADLFLQCCGVELEETFTLTKSEIIKNKDKTLKEMFKGVFEVEKFTGWAKTKLEGNEKWLVYFENNIMKYGFDANGKYYIHANGLETFDIEFDYQATKEEVKTALVNECKKRGYKEGDDVGNFNGHEEELILSNNYEFLNGLFFMGGTCIFEKGNWATIIETITKEEAEKQLNKKIV
jgi:hypothetical protein